MEIREIADKQVWEGFLERCSRKTFLHSWNWGEFQKSLGEKIWRFGIYETGDLISAALVVKKSAKMGSFLLLPHGPVTNHQDTRYNNQTFNSQILQAVTGTLKELARQEHADFIRISPIWERTADNETPFKKLGFRLRPLHTHPESSWKLDLSSTEEVLMAGMRKTTRYLVKQAQSNPDLEIIQSFEINDVDLFNQMHLEVVKRHKFVPFSLEYFRKEFIAFLPDNQIGLFFAKYKGEAIAASYGIFWSGMAFYHHAALLPAAKKIPASYLLQWSAIKEAKKRRCKTYDFWGYSDPIRYPNHPYSGPTLFKMGFGGHKDEYVKTQDFIISQKYWISYIIETARRVKRGL